MQQELPPFEATWEIFKDNVTYTCIGEPASQKKTAKQNAAANILEILFTKYIFLEEVSEKCLVTESKSSIWDTIAIGRVYVSLVLASVYVWEFNCVLIGSV